MADGFRFRRQHRLLKTAEYTEVFSKRRVLRGDLLDLHYARGSMDCARLGLVIPKRNAALAVTRNRCKRAARELFRLRRAELPVFDLVLRLARPVKALDSAALPKTIRTDFDKLLGRLPR